MLEQSTAPTALSRRDFLSATGAAIGAATVPFGAALAQSTKYRRLNVSNPQSARVLASYKKAIRAMLALPPTDPRNWYRNALVHTLDCPHGNWWFPVWHRGYLGWFEQTCRELSGDPDFALPYWDWTAEPRVPAAMFIDVLTPTDDAYIAGFTEFKSQFRDVLESYWNALSQDQLAALTIRCFRNTDDVWYDIENNPMFFPRAKARGLTVDKPDFDADTTKAVSLPTLLDGLSPRDYITFGSPKTLAHSSLTGFSILEGQPHNLVHNNVGGIFTVIDAHGNPVTTNVGGFMVDFLSPVDPIFFLHHANIDRLWDVWTRKQQAFGYPTLPQDNDLARWSREQFLFFMNSKGQPVSKVTAGDYATIGDFNYEYEPGSGEQVVPSAATAAIAAAQPVQRFAAAIASPLVTATDGASGTVTIPAALLQAATGPNAPKLFAKVTIDIPPLQHAGKFRILVNAPAGTAGGGPASPHDAGVFAMFGHHIMQAPVTFTVPLSGSLAALRSANRLAANAPLNIRVVSEAGAMPPGAMPQMAPARAAGETAEITSIVVEAH
jgi:tyrosinase